MKSFYISFGQTHTHRVNNITWDKDVICEIKATTELKAREYAFLMFGNKWAFLYKEKPDMSYFPRGIIEL